MNGQYSDVAAFLGRMLGGPPKTGGSGGASSSAKDPDLPDFKFSPKTDSVSFHVYKDLAMHDPQSPANRQAKAYVKCSPVEALRAVNKPGASDSIKRAFASGGPSGIGPSVSANEWLAARTVVERVFAAKWAVSDQKLAPLLDAMPDLPARLRRGQLSSVDLPALVRLLHSAYDVKFSALVVSASDSVALLPLEHHTANELVLMLDPEIDSAATGVDAVSLFGSFLQDEGGLRAHKERQQSLQRKGQSASDVRDFQRRTERDFELRFAEWASGGSMSLRPSLSVLPPNLQAEFDDTVRLLADADDHQRIAKKLNGGIADELAKALKRLSKLEQDRPASRASSTSSAGDASDRSDDDEPTSRSRRGLEKKQQRDKERADVKRARGAVKPIITTVDDGAATTDDSAKNSANPSPKKTSKVSFKDDPRDSVVDIPCMPGVKGGRPGQWARLVRTALEGSKWVNYKVAGQKGQKARPCWVAYLEPTTGVKCAFGKDCMFSHERDSDFDKALQKKVVASINAAHPG